MSKFNTVHTNHYLNECFQYWRSKKTREQEKEMFEKQSKSVRIQSTVHIKN